MPKDSGMLFETNGMHIWGKVTRRIKAYSDDSLENTIWCSRPDLPLQHRLILYFYKGNAYAVSDKDIQDLERVDSLRGDIFFEETEKSDAAFELLLERGLKEKKVDDVRKWLSDHGHVTIDEEDIEDISQDASLEEMADIYRKLDEKYLPLMREKQREYRLKEILDSEVNLGEVLKMFTS